MTICFFETTETNGSMFKKFPLRRSGIMNFENNEKYWFRWSKLATVQPYQIIHRLRKSNYRQYFDEFNIQDFNFSDGCKCDDVDNFRKLNTLSINLFELNFFQDQNKWNNILIASESSKNYSNRNIDLFF